VSDSDSADKLYDGEVGEKLAAMMPDIGIYCLGWCEYGFRNTYNNIRPITTVDDFKGLKMRSIESSISVDMWTAFGADPTVMGWTDVYTGLQMGTVDGADGPNTLFQTSKMEEVVKYMSTTQHMYTPGMIQASKAAMDKLPPDLWKIVQEVGKEAADYMKKMTRESQEKAVETMKANGLQVNEVSDDVRGQLSDLCKDIYTKNRDVIGADFYDYVMGVLGR
jgi:TRAP-type C4-dicarboxylate transport system substrate-binding protein